MNEKIVKNFLFIVNHVPWFFIVNIVFISIAIEGAFNWVVGIICVAINFLLILAFLLPAKYTMSTVHFTDSNITVRLFSKELYTYKWEDFSNISFQYSMHGLCGVPTVKFYIKSQKPVVEYELTKKGLALLKKVDKLEPKLKELVDSMELRRGKFKDFHY